MSNRIALFRVPLSVSLQRLTGLPRAAIGMVLAHGGLGIMVVGIIAISLWKVEIIIAMKPGETVDVAGYAVTFNGETPLTGPNYTGLAGQFDVARDGQHVTRLVSEKRNFKPSGMPTTEVGLHQSLPGDLYVVMGDANLDGGRSMRLYFNPLVNLIWIGAALMFLGGAFSLADRRYRVGAPRPSAAPGKTVVAE